MARTLDQIIAELSPTYQPQVESLQSQMGAIPGQIATQETALNAQKDQGYADILSGARQRGLGFSGIPLSEQAKYNATTYAPALANLKTAGITQAASLQDALNAIQEKKMTLGQNIYQTEQQREYDAQQAALNRQSSSTDLSKYFNTLTPTASAAASGARYEQTKPGSFAFYDEANKPITAAKYAQSTNQTLGDVLYSMGKSGDNNAKRIYNALADNPNNWQLQQALSKQFPYILGGL